MTKRATPPPPGDKPTGSAPPPPPTWRNWLWPIMIFAILALFFLLPTRTASTSLSYTQFLADVSAGKVKTVQLASTAGGTSSGTLTNKTNFTVVVPPQAGQELLTELQANKVDDLVRPVGERFRHRGAGLPDHLRAADPDLRLAVPKAVPGRRGRRAAGRARRRPVAGQGVRRGAARHHVRRRGRLRGRQGRDRRGGGLPAGAGPVQQGRRVGAAGRAHDRAARDRQDAAGPRGRGRGQGAVLLGHRVQLRGAVRRRRRVPGPRPVRRGAQARARHHLHRRDRRHRPAPRGSGRGGVQRRARADAQPAAGRDGRLRALLRRGGPRGHQPARDPRPGAAAARPVRPPGHDPAAERQRARPRSSACTSGTRSSPRTWT